MRNGSAATIAAPQPDRVLVPRLLDGTACVLAPDGRLRIEGPGASSTLPPLPEPLAGTLSTLTGNTRALDALIDGIEQAGGPGQTAMLFAYLARFSTQGLLTHHLVVDGEELASIEATGVGYRFFVRPMPDTKPIRLSRFGILRRDGDEMVLESSLGHALLRIRQAAAMATAGMLAAPVTPAALRERVEPLGLSGDAVAGLLTLLQNGGLLDDPAEPESDDRKLWNAHDLAFHMSSRYGRFGGDYGGGFRHVGEMEPAPAVRPLPDGPRIPLPVPVLEDLLRGDPPFQQVVETRTSIYHHGPSPITLDDLGEFLYRVARVRWIGHQEVTSTVTGLQGRMDISSRPVPAGGRGYDLELYLTVVACQGLEAGMYHYDPAGHQLTLIRPADALTAQMMTYATIASPGAEPQVLITLASRFRRMMWKYDRLAYAATLKHVGVLMQQMYLAATAMRLAPSALGSGNIETFAAATGNDPLVEGSVGEFILGAAPGEPRPFRPAMLYPEPSS